MEAWEVVKSGLVSDGVVKDVSEDGPSGRDAEITLCQKQVLYGLPVAINKLADLSDLWDEVAKDGAIVRLLVDHPRQIEALEDFEKRRTTKRTWSVFVKLDGNQK
jgi:D-serine deaminase-like pyridoxal phosphate-dependent protein